MSIDATELVDRVAIQELMYRYGIAVDGRDWDAYRTLFTPDAVIDYSDTGGERANVDTTVAWLGEVLAFFAGLQHNMTNHVVEIQGDDARACTYYVAYHTMVEDTTKGEAVLAVGGFYRDRLMRTPPGWKIAERVELGEWMHGPYQEGVAMPPWYGAKNHHRPSL